MATITSNGSGGGYWSATTTWVGGAVPITNSAVVIAAGDTVILDTATNNLQGLTIQGSSGTPGTLQAVAGQGTVNSASAASSNGVLNILTAYNIVGTSGTNPGRLLLAAGTWASPTNLAQTYTCIISLQGTATINMQYLSITCLDKEPTHKYARSYGQLTTVTNVNTSTGTLTLNTWPGSPSWANATAVRLHAPAGSTLPTGFVEDYTYYITNANSGAKTLTLAAYSGGATLVPTGAGSGTIDIYDGAPSTTTALNVLDDVTSDTPWVTTTNFNACTTVSEPAGNYQQLRTTISTITSTVITVAAGQTSLYTPGAKIFLNGRNIEILSAGTSASQAIVDFSSATTRSGTFQCSIQNTGGSGTTFYGYGINTGSGHTVSGTISGCNIAINTGTGHAVSGTISGCSTAINTGSGHIVSGTISGCTYGINIGSGHTVSGMISGCSYGINTGSGHIVSGTISGCNYGIYTGSGHAVSGTISGCSTGINYGTGHIVSGTISGCSTGIGYGTSYTVSGTISGCSIAINSGSGHAVSGTISGCSTGISTGGSLLTPTSVLSNNTTCDILGPAGFVCRSAALNSTTPFSGFSTNPCIGGASQMAVNYNPTIASVVKTGWVWGYSSGGQVKSTTTIPGSPPAGLTAIGIVHQHSPIYISLGSATVTATANNSGAVQLTLASALAATIPSGSQVFVSGVGGTTEANGTWSVTSSSSTVITLTGSTYANAWTSGGTVYLAFLSPNWVDFPIVAVAGRSVNVTIYAYKDTNGMLEIPEFQIVDPTTAWYQTPQNSLYANGNDGAVLTRVAMTDNTSWQTLNLSYTPSTTKQLTLRARVRNGAGNLYWNYSVSNNVPSIGSFRGAFG